VLGNAFIQHANVMRLLEIVRGRRLRQMLRHCRRPQPAARQGSYGPVGVVWFVGNRMLARRSVEARALRS